MTLLKPFCVILVGPFYYEENYLHKDPANIKKYIWEIWFFFKLKENF